jgi:hypothetical protein
MKRRSGFAKPLTSLRATCILQASSAKNPGLTHFNQHLLRGAFRLVRRVN